MAATDKAGPAKGDRVKWRNKPRKPCELRISRGVVVGVDGDRIEVEIILTMGTSYSYNTKQANWASGKRKVFVIDREQLIDES